ncbi:hypothetical protein SAMN04488082_11311 [Desulfomicrobium apsheronum]|uniref:Uncharacterized protein n=1 Tax=Desulfomicrobium apsheronum TaxID=52560 RepID=A0A1I3WF67_9BACT|nr:hypothetical protein SAMN04488082_11311 [Desulfomicrobium apsheronum]
MIRKSQCIDNKIFLNLLPNTVGNNKNKIMYDTTTIHNTYLIDYGLIYILKNI